MEYSGRRVLDVPRLEISAGEFFGLLGPNGSGKSTLLRLLHGLEMPSSGSIELDSRPLDERLPLAERRKIGMVFQRPELIYGTVFENIALGMKFRGWKIDGRIEALLDRLEILHLRESFVHRLSGGELQRVALARTLVCEPQVLLLDEPTANLDPYQVGLIESILVEFHQRHRPTVVLVSHNIHQARRLAERVGLLLAGHLIEAAETDRFFEHARDGRVRAFLAGELIY